MPAGLINQRKREKMTYALWITGIPAGLAMAFPKLVATAYFFLIVPGVILTIAPTVFVYLAGTAILRRVIPFKSRATATVLSFVLMLGLGWAVMQPFQATSLKSYEASYEPDIISNEPIELHGRVLIEAPDSRDDPDCNYLCLAALDSPLVDSVTMVTGGRAKKRRQQSAAYKLQSAETNAAAGLFPRDPGRIVREFRPMKKNLLRGSGLTDASRAIEADWAVRLAGAERLRAADPLAADDSDWVIRIDRLNRKSKSRLRRITISDAAGTVRYRKSYRNQPIPAAMFYFGFEISAGSGTISGGSFHVGRQFMTSGSVALHPESELLNAIGFQIPPLDAAIVRRLRTAAKEALNDPEASDVRVDLARRYLGLFFFDATEQDYELIARIVTDARVRDLDEQLMNVFSKKKTPTEMKDAYAERITMDHTSAKLRRWLAEGLAELPAGTFANPSPAHMRIWNSPANYQDAGPFFSRTADLGAVRALPLLQVALDRAVAITAWNDRRPLIEGIRNAFVKLGPSASGFAPQLCELFLRRPSPLMNDSGQADDWRFALARMGVDIKDLPFFSNQSSDMVQRISDKVAHRLRRYEQELIAETNR